MHDDLGLYVLGGLEDTREFEAHLQTCAECREEVRSLRRVMAVLDDSLGQVAPPQMLRARTLAAVRRSAEPRERRMIWAGWFLRPNRWAGIAAIAAAALLVVGIGVRTITLDSFNPDRILTLIAPDGGPARAIARVDDTPSEQIIELEVRGLPPAPEGSHYECWWVGEGDSDDLPNRVSAGTFRAGNGTYRMTSSADPARFAKMGVTLEPMDGNPARTGPKVLVTESSRPD